MGAKGMEIRGRRLNHCKESFEFFDKDKRVQPRKEMRDADAYTIKTLVDGKELMYRARRLYFM